MTPTGGGRSLYRWFLRILLPAEFRERHENEMVQVFRHLLEDARSRGSWGRFITCLREGSALLVLARRLRRESKTGPAGLKAVGVGAYALDVKLGLRMLVKHPGLTLVAVFALAVGIPVGLAPMHLVNAIQAPPPVDESERIQVLRHVDVERVENFLYFENVTAPGSDRFDFDISTLPELNDSTFVVMDAGDLDADGDLDIVLGGRFRRPPLHRQGLQRTAYQLVYLWNR